MKATQEMIAGALSLYDWLLCQHKCTCGEEYTDRNLISPHCERHQLESWGDLIDDEIETIAADRLKILQAPSPAQSVEHPLQKLADNMKDSPPGLSKLIDENIDKLWGE